jgi:hypothetical protein
MKIPCKMCGDGCVNETLGMCLDCGYHYSKEEYLEEGGSECAWDYWRSGKTDGDFIGEDIYAGPWVEGEYEDFIEASPGAVVITIMTGNPNVVIEVMNKDNGAITDEQIAELVGRIKRLAAA